MALIGHNFDLRLHSLAPFNHDNNFIILKNYIPSCQMLKWRKFGNSVCSHCSTICVSIGMSIILFNLTTRGPCLCTAFK